MGAALEVIGTVVFSNGAGVCWGVGFGDGLPWLLASGVADPSRRDLSRAASASSLVGVFALSITSTLISLLILERKRLAHYAIL